ncbi:type VI secretion system Vgr family protein [Chromobacterium phragmitis]|uniref:Type VI secretion system Vgr family protein n=1 Tax=Chromobacterium phragmitis TaxID=2202141 RepID=A0ABV0ISH6_9NEIS
MDISSLLASFASAFTQDKRLLTLSMGEGTISANQLLPYTLEGEEGISEAYRYQLTCLSPDGSIELKSLLGQPVRIGIEDAKGVKTVRCGVVSKAELLGSDGGFAKYGLTIEPPFALLRHRRTSRVFQDMTVPDIIQQVISEHQASNPIFAKVQALTLQVTAKEEDQRSYCLQYRESDYDFLVRLMHEEGFSWRFDHREGDSPQVALVVFDDAFNLPAAALDRVRFHRSDATEEEDGLTGWNSARQIVPGNVALASYDYQPVSTGHALDESQIEQGQSGKALQSTLQDYDPQALYYARTSDQFSRYAQLRQQAHDLQAKQFEGSGSVRGLVAGQWFRLEDHPAHEFDSSEQREFVVTRQTFQAQNNLPADLTRRLSQAAPALLAGGLATDAVLKEGGNDSTSVPFTTRFQAQRRGIPLTPPYAHTELAKPTSLGVQTATVVGPSSDEVHTDQHGRIKVQFHWQRPEEHAAFGANNDDKSSCWLRVVMPSAGAGWGHQFIPRIGQEVLVDFIEGDIDRPVVTGVLYNGSHPVPDFSGAGTLPANKTLSGIKSKEHQGSGYNELLFDDTPGEVRAKLSSEPGKTQLNQGFLTHPRKDGKAEPRGQGFELRTDLSGAIRAAQGVLVSAHGREGAGGNQLDREELIGQLEMALSIAQSLAKQAEAHQADDTDTKPQEQLKDDVKQWEGGSNTAKDAKGGNKAILALTAPEGIAVASEANISIATGSSHDLIASKDSNLSIGQHLRMRIGQSLSIFVMQLGMKLISASGAIRIQAQNDDIEIIAAKRLRLVGLKDVSIEGPQVKITAQSAGVEYGGGITAKTTGSNTHHAASHVMDGPASVSPQNALKSGKADHDQKVQLFWQGGGEPIANRQYRMKLEDGRVLSGKTDASGFAQHVKSEIGFARYKLELLPEQ